jgi:hypothetical protein
MRMLMNVIFPPDTFNAAVRDGSIGPTIQKILEATKPESVYFVEQDGMRSAVMIVNPKEASDIPALAEPWFLQFEAEVQFRIAMTPEDLQRSGLDALGKKWG